MQTLHLLAIAALSALVGCSGNTTLQQTNISAAKPGTSVVVLSAEQQTVVEAGVREMMGGTFNEKLRGVKALTLAGKPGIHVCGAFSNNGAELPFYLELGEKNGAPVATRGQIGSDPGKKAKVTFVCRHHS